MIPFSPPYINQEMIDEVVDTLKSGWITTGPKTQKFEKRLAQYTGAPQVLCVNAATSGLELMLRWFGVTSGDEVILPAYTYCSTANVVEHCGATPVFVDVNSSDFNIDLQEVEKAITERTKAIIPVDFGGVPCDYEGLNDLVRAETIQNKFSPQTPEQEQLGRIFVLSDAAHSLGAEYKGQKTGSLTDVSVFSFHAVKNLTTAEGGAICLNLPQRFDNHQLYKELRITALHGQSKDALSKFNKKGGSWRYDVIEAGYKFNMPDVLAAMGLVQMKLYESQILPQRKKIFDTYTKAFDEYDWATPPLYQDQHRQSSCHIYALRIKNCSEKQRDAVIEHLKNEGVASNVHFIPLPMMKYYNNKGYKIDDYPNAYDNYKREISLPVFYDLKKSQMKKVINKLIESVNEIL